MADIFYTMILSMTTLLAVAHLHFGHWHLEVYYHCLTRLFTILIRQGCLFQLPYQGIVLRKVLTASGQTSLKISECFLSNRKDLN